MGKGEWEGGKPLEGCVIKVVLCGNWGLSSLEPPEMSSEGQPGLSAPGKEALHLPTGSILHWWLVAPGE